MINEILLTSTLLFSSGARNNELNTTYYTLPTLEAGTFDLITFKYKYYSVHDNRFYVEITPHRTTLFDDNNNQYLGYEFDYSFYYNNTGILDITVVDNAIFELEIINGNALYYDLKPYTQNQYWEVQPIKNTNTMKFTEYLFDNEYYSTEIAVDYNVSWGSDYPLFVSDYMSENYLWYDYIYECQINYSHMLELNNQDKLGDIQELEESVDNLQNDIAILDENLTDAYDNINALENMVDGLNNEIVNLRQTIYNLNESLASATAPQSVFQLLTKGFESVARVLEFELIPHVTIGLLVSIPIIGAILFFVIKLLVV